MTRYAIRRDLSGGGLVREKPHIRLHTTGTGWWWAERYIDCKHGWDLTGDHPAARDAVAGMLGGHTFNRRAWLAQWPNQLQGVRP